MFKALGDRHHSSVGARSRAPRDEHRTSMRRSSSVRFDAAIPGAYYAQVLAEAERLGRVDPDRV